MGDEASPDGIRICIDRGGTFTDCIGFVPDASQPGGYRTIVLKVLSVDPAYPDAPREGIRRILELATGSPHPRHLPVPTSSIASIRMGTTVATNALLERKGEPCALLITKGFKELLHIGNQARPDIFDLTAACPDVLYDQVVEIDERVTLLGYTCSPLGANVAPPADDPSYEKGITGEWIHVLKKPDLQAVEEQLKAIKAKGIKSVAICLMHSYTFPAHERLLATLASTLGFTNITLSSTIMPMIKIVPRGTSATVDAYLTPCITRYIDGFFAGFDEGIKNVRVEFMQSDGGLAPVGNFSGFRAILSGPAGGVVGYAVTSYDPTEGSPVIGFDMGGTSTDVSRFAGGRYEHVFETTTAGVTIQAPQLDINTVAAGGGSRLFFRNGLFVVGPESASAHPGPACYRKGGPLAITDANLFLGRLVPLYFPKIFGPGENEPLDLEATREAFDALAEEINKFQRSTSSREYTLDEIAYGFLEVANEAMSRPIRTLTQAKGHDTAQHVLACFGGAGAQHACKIAAGLGIGRILVHRFASILSAYGLSLADVVVEVQEPAQTVFGEAAKSGLEKTIAGLTEKCVAQLEAQGFKRERGIDVEVFLNLRYQGTDTAMMTLQPAEGSWEFDKAFVAQYQQEFGFTLPDRAIVVDDVRVRGIGKSFTVAPRSVYEEAEGLKKRKVGKEEAVATSSAYFGPALGRIETPVFDLTRMMPGDVVVGPAIIVEPNSVIVVELACEALVTSEHVLIDVKSASKHSVGEDLDPIQLSIFSHRFMSIAEQMGHTLQRTSVSTNIKERLDFSCALFGPDGGLVSNAPHIPVHLGSMQEAVRYQIDFLKDDLKDGDVIVSNHPNAGGSHLPDITVITPVFEDASSTKPVFFVASRGHHADIGGAAPGSMPPFSKELFQEGAAIKSFKLVHDGVFDEAGIIKRLVDEPGSYPGCSGTRILKDNLSDLKAQVAANQKGINLVRVLIKEYTLPVVQAYMRYIRENAELAVRDLLMKMYDRHGKKRRLEAIDYMDDGTPIKLTIDIDPEKREAVFDFTGTGPEVYGNTNAPKAITYSAIIYCLRALVGQDIPLNQGCLAPIKIIIPEGSLLSPGEGAAVVGGNVLTSQRLVDVVLLAFGACAASQGCMNNLTFGAQAQDVGAGNGWGYYETIAGGAGAGPTWPGRSGVHTHMTNTRITDPEILERRYPVILREFGLRKGSGGEGMYRGGDGVIRELEFLEPVDVNILSERRVVRPYGMAGGEPGQAGRNLLIKVDPVTRKDIKVLNLGGKNTVKVQPHDRFRLEAPGGGGYGPIGGQGVPTKSETVPLRTSGSVLQRSLDAYSV